MNDRPAEWAQEAAERIADKAMPAFQKAWNTIADEEGLEPEEIWSVLSTQVFVLDELGIKLTWEQAVTGYKFLRDKELG